MAPSKVLVKCTNNKLCKKRNLLQLLNGFSIRVVKVAESGKDFNLFCDGIVESEKIFTDNVLSSLTASGFTPTLPPELRSSRSVIIRKVDYHIIENSVQNIKEEIVRCNRWCEVDEVIKFTHSLKIVFTSSSMEGRCIDSGLSMFY